MEEQKEQKRGRGRPKGSRTKPKDPQTQEKKDGEKKAKKSVVKNTALQKGDDKATFVCEKCGKKRAKDEMVLVNGQKLCSNCSKPESMVEYNKILADRIYEIVNHDRNDMVYLISVVQKTIGTKDSPWTTLGVLATLDYIEEAGLYSHITAQNAYQMIKKYYGAGVRELAARNRANEHVPKNIDAILNREVKVIEKKRSAWEKDNQLSEERRKNREYGPQIDLNDIPEDD